MGKLLGKPFVSRVVGALSAGAGALVLSHDWHAAAATAATFIIYGAAHTTTSSAAN
jgi:hypothetical protein